MADLTTSSPFSAFSEDLKSYAYVLDKWSFELSSKHRSADPSQGKFLRGGVEAPDQFTLLHGFTVALSMLAGIVAQIEQLEQVSQSEEADELEESDMYHTYGELFALKEMYIRLKAQLESLEIARLYATELCVEPKRLLHEVVAGNGVPKLDDYSYNGFLSNFTANRGGIRYGGTQYLKQASTPVPSGFPPIAPDLDLLP